jgi:aspartate-semialdehyde dehydrogenase
VSSERALQVAVFGATGLVGREIVTLLEERSVPIGHLLLFATESSEGERIELGEESVVVSRVPKELPEVDVAFLCASGQLSREVAEELAEAGALVIDLAAGGFEEAPLLLGAGDLGSTPRTRRGGLIVRVPDPLTRMIAVPLRALASAVGPRRAIATAVVPASAFGRKSVDRLSEETIGLLNFQQAETDDDEEGEEADAQRPQGMAFRGIPETPTDPASVSARATNELPKLLPFPLSLAISGLRAPIFSGLAVSLSVELVSATTAEAVHAALREAPSLVVEEPGGSSISTYDVLGAEGIYIVGMRHDAKDPAWIHFWVLADNVRHGAALAAVSLAEGVLLKH